METTERFHVNQEVSGPHNERDEKLIERENRRHRNRWIDPKGHEAWPGVGGVAMSEREACVALFADSVAAYNAKQRRKDRLKTVDSYMEEVKADTRGRTNKAIAAANERAKEQGRVQDVRKEKGKHLTHEVVLSLGSVADRVPEDVAKKIYQQYAEEWATRNPNFYLYRVDYHDGEYFRSKKGQDITDKGGPPGKWTKGVPHPHFAFIPYADGAFKQGLSRQVSTGKALEAMGCKSWDEWQDRERGRIAEIAAQYGYTVVKSKEQRETQLTTPEFQQLQDERQELEEQRQTVKAEAEKTVKEAEAQAGLITGKAHTEAALIHGKEADWGKAHKQAAKRAAEAQAAAIKAQAEQEAQQLREAVKRDLEAAGGFLERAKAFYLSAEEKEQLRQLEAEQQRRQDEIARAEQQAGNVRGRSSSGPSLDLR